MEVENNNSLCWCQFLASQRQRVCLHRKSMLGCFLNKRFRYIFSIMVQHNLQSDLHSNAKYDQCSDTSICESEALHELKFLSDHYAIYRHTFRKMALATSCAWYTICTQYLEVSLCHICKLYQSTSRRFLMKSLSKPSFTLMIGWTSK